MSHILPKTRATRDISGRLVDLYPAAEDTYLSVLVLDRTRLNESRLRYDVFAVMASIAAMANSRLRDRDFPVYRCDWTTGGRRLTGIGLPEIFPAHLHLAFQRPIRDSAGIVEIGRGRASDVGARPFMLYNHGKLIAYLSWANLVRTLAGDCDRDVAGRYLSLRAALWFHRRKPIMARRW